jgi:hypothetical protein
MHSKKQLIITGIITLIVGIALGYIGGTMIHQNPRGMGPRADESGFQGNDDFGGAKTPQNQKQNPGQQDNTAQPTNTQ